MRLIDADALVSALNNGRLKEQTGRAVPFNSGVAFALTMVEYAQTIDAVPVVRCKDCRWWDKEREQCGITPSASPYGHCHDGETLKDLTSADVAPVRHGHWDVREPMPMHDIKGNLSWGNWYVCTGCGFATTAIEGHITQYKYCPSCGAFMGKDGDEDEID